MTEGWGQLLRQVREDKGLTQQELAERMGCTQPAVSQVENSDGQMTLATASKYLAALGYHLEIWLSTDSGSIRLND